MNQSSAQTSDGDTMKEIYDIKQSSAPIAVVHHDRAKSSLDLVQRTSLTVASSKEIHLFILEWKKNVE